MNTIGRLSGRHNSCRRSSNNLSSFRFRGARFFSAEEPPKEDQETDEESSKIASGKVVFPWRHEESPLPRLVEGTIDHATKGQLLSTVTTKTGNVQMNALASAFMFLDVPLYQFLFFGSWKGELADSVSWAFTQGTAGLLADLASPSVPMNSIISDMYELNFHEKLGGTKAVTMEAKDDDSEKVDNPVIPLEDMLEEKLIALYQSAKENNISEEVEVCLKTIPYSAELVSLYAIPYISRRNIKSDKALLNFYRTMMKKPSMDRTEDLNKLRKDKLEKGIMESTVIAQVLVWCHEVFYVKKVDSGEVIQGTADNDTARNVPHLVRMESTVKTTKDAGGAFRNVQEDWIITDIDDMLDGNLIV